MGQLLVPAPGGGPSRLAETVRGDLSGPGPRESVGFRFIWV